MDTARIGPVTREAIDDPLLALLRRLRAAGDVDGTRAVCRVLDDNRVAAEAAYRTAVQESRTAEDRLRVAQRRMVEARRLSDTADQISGATVELTRE